MELTTRTKRLSHRSRTGCRTCRKRHVKCDETPGSCLRCKSSGWKCEGYDIERLPRNRPTERPCPSLARTFRWKTTSDEQRCFSFFQHRTAPTIIAYFDCTMWQEMVLRASQVEPAVFHAVVAFSAVHADYEMSSATGLARPDNLWQQFATDQCGRAYQRLSLRSASHDPLLRDVTLVCCVLFMMVDMMRGQPGTALVHLQHGLQILHESRNQAISAASAAFHSMLGQCLSDAFVSLDVQSIYLGIGDSTPTVAPSSPALDDFTFDNLREARQRFDLLMGDIIRFHSYTSSLSLDYITTHYLSLSNLQFTLTSRLNRFNNALNTFRRGSLPALSAKGQRSLHTIQLHQMMLSILLDKCLLLQLDDILGFHSATFEQMITLAETLISSFTDRPSVCLDMGVILPLSFIQSHCREPSIQQRANYALREWPHREGPWDSSFFAESPQLLTT
ncbi:hypothetical protein BJY04DRAFT_232213 [Aspergillus karnatakaensis]|uniref:Zn(II)2Cys6 transcription factor n=1 Tax=Aspergillus karnatakaensis TaxID=1810916 RepID=UPI003CCD0E8C